ncbi:MAG TPA: DNA adenine methylase [Candidatus Saccharibacteria bacterium]|nr:DNA adenine methylase [Candidatus Saccharibacteria bacterium]
MARHYGIPYMGSKQKLVDKVVPFILNRHPGADSFYDLFGGGGSVSLYVVSKYPHLDVVYNERSKAISALMQRLKDGENLGAEWIDRDTFERKYTGDDWFAGLLQTCYTFGNNQKSYLYGKPLEEFKEHLTDLVMTGEGDIAWLEQKADEINLKEHGKVTHTKIFLNSKRYKTPYQRRIVLARQIGSIGALQHISRIERLNQIANMPGISTLGISAGTSYNEVPIIGERPIIYCDPPYEGTAEYREGDFDHKAFYDWVMEQTCPVYVSSYNVSDPRLKRVKAINTRSLLNSSKSKESTYNYENIYWNGVM